MAYAEALKPVGSKKNQDSRWLCRGSNWALTASAQLARYTHVTYVYNIHSSKSMIFNTFSISRTFNEIQAEIFYVCPL